MKGLQLFLCFNLFLVSFLRQTSADQSKSNGVYIVYMGATRWPNGAPRNDHSQLITSLTKRKENAVLHTYSNGFLGFAARLSEEEAESIAKKPGVVSVFPDPVLKLHTTRSWDFLKQEEADLEAVSTPRSSVDLSSTNGTDTIIGFLDSGIWPESESFNDAGMGPIPSRWKGKCMEGRNFTSANCNRKLIGARYYEGFDTPRDEDGHGTHVASTAAGTPVPGASYYGLANGTARGGSPGSRIAMYRVCTVFCFGSAIMKALDDAIGDGVDVLSLSLGRNDDPIDFSTEPVAIGAFHAMENGIVVACAAGNDGPIPATVENVAPWILTVAATTIDRDLEVDVVLGGGKVIKGGGINFSNLKKSPVYPLIDGPSAKSKSSQEDEHSARNCDPDLLDPDKVKGKILLCEAASLERFESLRDQLGAIGMITISDADRQAAFAYKDYPISAVTEEDGAQILSYIKSSSNPVATILPTKVIPNYKPAPVAAVFSSKGPISRGLQNLIKPDIAAPGVNILAAWAKINDEFTLPGKDPSPFVIISGTSMSCPHVSGLAAIIKSRHPTWSPAAIRSAIMTTAIQTDNLHSPITNFSGLTATPYDIGAGEISLSGPLDPGLIYETGKMDYIQFLCNAGYNTTTIKLIASDVPQNFSCPVDSSSVLISNMNYPSIAVSLKEYEIKTVDRVVTNVGEDESTYIAVVEEPSGVDVQVVPGILEFTKDVKKLRFQVIFEMTEGSQEDLFGSITWSNKKYRVRSPFVVSNAGQES